VNQLKAANAALDKGTVPLADLVMDLAMEEQLRKKGMLEEAADPPIGTSAAASEPIAPTGTEGSIPLKGE
jgi:hypothetical protein